jgi:excisionase family DNA binding protein
MFDYYEPLCTFEELCDYLQVGRNSAYRLLKSGQIKAWKIGRVWKIPKRAVQDYICKQTQMKAAMWIA